MIKVCSLGPGKGQWSFLQAMRYAFCEGALLAEHAEGPECAARSATVLS
jgi:hypothetical protein